MASAIETIRNKTTNFASYAERKRWQAESMAPAAQQRLGIMQEVQLVGSAMVIILIIALVLTEVFEAVEFEQDADGNYTGPFGEIVGDLETTGVAAMSLLVVGLIVVAASAIMRFFGGGFGGR